MLDLFNERLLVTWNIFIISRYESIIDSLEIPDAKSAPSSNTWLKKQYRKIQEELERDRTNYY